MLDNKTIVKTTNRSNSVVVYSVEDLNVHRTYNPQETKEVTFEELKLLSYKTGGSILLENYLLMDNKEAVEELLGDVEPEYFYTIEDIKYLLKHGSIAQLEDCLDFGPEGVVDLVKDCAVKIELNDVSKRKVIFDKLGFNIDKAIEIKHITMESQDIQDDSMARNKRRAKPINSDELEELESNENIEQATRRTEPIKVSDKYKIIK